eukprot:m.147072 g.147072  ORF g.147072 m.147072 type:complete len:1091 (-) comp14160_c0_seq5:576-3848(-)
MTGVASMPVVALTLLTLLGAQHDTFRAWLYKVEVELPNVNGTVGDWNIEAYDLVCGNVTFEKLHGHPVSDLQLRMVADGVDVECYGRWKATNTNTSKTYQGHADLGVNATDIQFQLDMIASDTNTSQVHVHSVASNISSAFKVEYIDLVGASPEVEKEFDAIKPVLKAGIDLVLEATVRLTIVEVVDSLLNSVLDSINTAVDNGDTPPEPLPLPVYGNDTVNLLTSPFVQFVNYFTEQVLYNTALFNINTLLRAITNGTDAIVADNITTVNFTVPLSEYANVTIFVDSLSITNLSTIEKLSVGAINSKQLQAALFVNGPMIDAKLHYTLNTSSPANATVHIPSLTEPVHFAATLSPANLQVILDVDVAANRLHSLDPVNFYQKGCVPSLLRACALSAIDMDFDLHNVTFQAIDDPDVEESISSILSTMTAGYGSSLPQALQYSVLREIRSSLNEQLQLWLYTSDDCDNSPEESWLAAYVSATILTAIILMSYLTLHLNRDLPPVFVAMAAASNTYPETYAHPLLLQDKPLPLHGGLVDGTEPSALNSSSIANTESTPLLLSAASPTSKEQKERLEQREKEKQEAEEYAALPLSLRPKAGCFGMEPTISKTMRYGMPIAISMATFLLVLAQSRIAGAAFFQIHYNDTAISLPVVKTLQFVPTVIGLWQGKIYAICLSVTFLSGFWPHIKLVMMLFAWVAPVRWLSVKGRESYLQWLDFFGKWSILDIYISVLFVVGMHLHVPMDNATNVYIDLWVASKPALYYYWATIIFSLIITHVLLHLHREVVRKNGNLEPKNTRSEALSGHRFSHTAGIYKLTRTGKLLMGALLFATVALILVGASSVAFTFHFKGLAAWLLRYTGQEDTKEFSLMMLATSFRRNVDTPNTFGTLFSQSSFTLFALVVPLVQQTVLFLLWYLPLSPRWQARGYYLSEILHAWAALEVFMLAIIVTVFQLPQMAAYIIGDKCAGINAILKLIMDKELQGSDTCFDVEPEFHRGSWILLFCAVSSFASTLSILRLSHSAVSERNGLKHTHVERSSAVAVNGDDQDEIAVAAAAAAAATSTHANEPTTQSLSFSLRVLVASGMVVFEASN